MTTPLIERRITVIQARHPADQCWPWDGTIHKKGYGLLHGGEKAHRAAYAHFVGAIPDGMVIDHECHNQDPACKGGDTCPHRRCVNPRHLVARAPGTNTTRGFATRATCRTGRHVRSPENTGTTHDGGSFCKPCAAAARRAYNDGKRREARRAAGVRERRDGYCPRGHEFTDENTYHYVRGGKPRRMCRTCKRAGENARNAARRRGR